MSRTVLRRAGLDFAIAYGESMPMPWVDWGRLENFGESFLFVFRQ